MGQVAPAAATLTTLYTATGPVIVSALSVCNTSTVATTFRIAHRLAGASATAAQYVFYDLAIAGNATALFSVAICLANTDVLSVYATLATVSFNAWGVEAP